MAAHFHLNESAAIFINGAEVRPDRRVRLSVSGAGRLLLESQIVPAGANDDPISGLATLLQRTLTEPEAFSAATVADDLIYRDLMRRARAEAVDRDADNLLADVHLHLSQGRIHQALRLLRKSARQISPRLKPEWIDHA
ncbi:MAG: flagellar biosynthesis repressor FlbT [Pseudomonadota bacterium]